MMAVSVVGGGAAVRFRHEVARLWRPEAPAIPIPPRPPVGDIFQVADRLYVVPGGGGNTAVFLTRQGLVVVDPKFEERGADTLAQIRTITDLPIVTVINTHAHVDHFGGNTAMPPSVPIVVQERTAANIPKIRHAGDPRSFDGRPVRTFRTTLTLFEGEDAVDLYYFGRAHTDGDAFVVFRAAGVMCAGDMFPKKKAPVMNLPWGGSARDYAPTLERAVANVHGVSRVITGHDGVVPWSDLVDYAEFNRRLLDHVVAERAAGKDWNVAKREFVLPPKFSDYDLEELINTLHDMYKDMTPWWHFW
jgi:glyoxylase-like metal-dependent hydrolase (beta-lactamase superfamily II)